MKSSDNNTPRHIGIILDGNRRFAKRLMLEPWKGHEYGAGKIEKLFDWCKELDIKELTLYCFSQENFNRPKEEFDFLMNLFIKTFKKYKNDKRIHENKIKINFIGRTDMLPKELQKEMKEMAEKTKNYSDYIVNFALAYSGRDEILDAVKKIAKQVKNNQLKENEIDEKTFGKNLYINSEPDLIIRTGGEKRTSNFLPWQSVYSEWLFLDKMWPEFEKQDLINAIKDFKNRERRFGR